MTASPPTRKSALARLPPLNWLRAFEASARALSFTAAAQELNMTQSAVSQQIKSLESALGRLLFVRRVRGLELTDEGRGYLPTVQAAFAMLEEGTSVLTGRNDPAGREEQFERFYLILLDSARLTLSPFQVGAPDQELTLAAMLDDLLGLVAQRNPDFYELRDGRLIAA